MKLLENEHADLKWRLVFGGLAAIVVFTTVGPIALRPCLSDRFAFIGTIPIVCKVQNKTGLT